VAHSEAGWGVHNITVIGAKKKFVNLRCGISAAIIFCCVITIGVTTSFGAAKIPFAEKIGERVKLSILPATQALRVLLRELDSEDVLDHQFVSDQVYDGGEVAVIFFNNWKSLPTSYDRSLDHLMSALSKLKAADLAYYNEVIIRSNNNDIPYMLIVYNLKLMNNIT
jgi:hypothetical protein